MSFALDEARRTFHGHLLGDILTTDDTGCPSNADKDSVLSKKLAVAVVAAMGGSRVGPRQKAQSAGKKFEAVVHTFISQTFPLFVHLRPGTWRTENIQSRDGVGAISKFDQYQHLRALARAAKENRELAVALGNDYVIAPDIVVYREPEDDLSLNAQGKTVGPNVAALSSMRRSSGNGPILHASISCKWTIRSDRSQNARSEALNLIRNRKGRAPHIAVVTGEPLPKRIGSIALGTGDIDCVYHFALPELQSAAVAIQDAESVEMLKMLVEGKRLRDISDLPIDLAM